MKEHNPFIKALFKKPRNDVTWKVVQSEKIKWVRERKMALSEKEIKAIRNINRNYQVVDIPKEEIQDKFFGTSDMAILVVEFDLDRRRFNLYIADAGTNVATPT